MGREVRFEWNEEWRHWYSVDLDSREMSVRTMMKGEVFRWKGLLLLLDTQQIALS